LFQDKRKWNIKKKINWNSKYNKCI